MEPPTKKVTPSSEDKRLKDTWKSNNNEVIPSLVSGASFTSLDTLDALIDKPSGSEEQKEFEHELKSVSALDSSEQLSESSVETSVDREGLVKQV